MLVVRRRTGQSITISGGVEIEILEAGPGRVKLGISAPKTVSVCRKEIELTREQNRAAAASVTGPALSDLTLLLKSLSTSAENTENNLAGD